MSASADEGVLLFLALLGLYSPVAAVSSYLPVLQPFSPRQQFRIALGLFINVAGIAVVTVLIGEPLLHILGLTTAALSATGGISLMIAAVPLMTGRADPPAEQPASDTPGQASDTPGQDSTPASEAGLGIEAVSWRSVVFMPMTIETIISVPAMFKMRVASSP